MSEDMLVPLENYLSAGVHIGTKFRTKFMGKYIYKIRNDGLAVMNVQKIDERILNASKLMSRFEPNEILLVCRRDNAHQALKMFEKATGITTVTGRYLPGTMTNKKNRDFVEPNLLIVTDPWADRVAVKDALRVGIPIIAFCDTNNTTNKVDLAIPCNNKGKKSLGLVLWILANEYLKSKKLKMPYKIEEFVGKDSEEKDGS